nr:uncharacterized protein LOC117218724 isoform X2 [Megalopta genalis]XP_033323184.1 uncharacterized protein LOC117218724 isoform X2 [Megalopta genalis]
MARRGLIKRIKTSSTPKKFVTKIPSVSISSITPNSSSPVKQLKRQVDKEAEVKQKRRKKEQHAVPKRKYKKKNVKPRLRKEPEVSDSSWETTLEFTDDKKENLQPANSSPMTPLLFQGRPSPTLERIREAHCFYDFHFDSPVSRHGEEIASPVRADLGDGVELLHLKDLPSVHTLVYSSDEEDDLLLTKNHNKQLRTHSGVRHRRRPKISVDKSKRWLVDVKCPTVAADMLWDEYVRTHPEEMREYVAPATNQNVTSLPKRKKKNYDRDKAREEHGQEYWFGNEDAPKATYYRIDRHHNKFTKKWTQKEYPEAEDSDSDFGRIETGVLKMTLNQYLQKCKAKKHLASQMADPSYLKYDKVTNVTNRKRKIVNVENVNDLRISNIGAKSTPVIRSIEIPKGIKYVRKGFKWLIKRG